MMMLACLLILSFFSRLLVVKDAITGFDTFGHLYFSREVCGQKVGPFGAIRLGIVDAEQYRQPFLWHWLVGRFLQRVVLRHQKFINASVDAVFAVAIYYVALLLGASSVGALESFLLYLTTPMWFSRLAIGPRLSGFTPRLFSEICTNLFFVVTFLPLPLSPEMKLALAGCLGSFVLLSSKFGVQALFLLVPLSSAIAGNGLSIEALLLAVAVSLAVSRGAFFSNLCSQFNHLSWYFKKNLAGEMPVSNRNNLGLLFKRNKALSVRRQLEGMAERWLVQNSITSTFIKMPVVVALIVVLARSGFHGGMGNIPAFVRAPVFAALLVYAAINFPILLFLGEAERYLNHVAIFIVLSLSIALPPSGHWVSLVYFLIGYGVAYWLCEAFVLHVFEREQINKERNNKEVIACLQDLGEKHVVVCYPYHAVGVFRILLQTEHNVIYPLLSAEKLKKFSRFEKTYPYVDLTLIEEMHEVYGADLLILSRKALASTGLDFWCPPRQWTRLDVGGTVYDVYTRERAK